MVERNIFGRCQQCHVNSEHVNRTRYAGQQSVDASINASVVQGSGFGNASVVQGSGFGPSAYVVVASDLHPVHDH